MHYAQLVLASLLAVGGVSKGTKSSKTTLSIESELVMAKYEIEETQVSEDDN